jgi:lipopolysaccharide transport system permease protein
MMTGTTTAAREALLDLRADMSMATRHRLAVRDLTDGASLWRLAWTLGWLDIKLRYRGSLLGPFWLTLSTAIMVGSMGMLYATLFHLNLHEYLPFLSLSMLLWNFMAAVMSESCLAFTEAETIIRSVRMPFFVFAVRVVVRNLIVLGHNIVVIVAVFAILRVWPGAQVMFILPGLVFWMINSLALVLLLGAFCARFRDIQPIVNSLMQIFFFMTPVIWQPKQVGSIVRFLPFNPFYDLLEVVRGPLLGTVPDLSVWIGTMVCTLVLCTLSWSFFTRARGRVAFWL